METDRTSEKWLEAKINNDGIYNGGTEGTKGLAKMF